MENYQFEVKLGIGYPVHNNMSQANNAAKYYADEIIKILFKEKKRHMDPENRIALICRGSSGAIMATLTYHHLVNIDKDLESRIRVFHIKKEGESSHGSPDGGISSLGTFEDCCFIIDDFIDTGATIRAIYDRCKEQGAPITAIIATWYYKHSAIMSKYKDTEIKYLVSEPV